MSKMQAYRQADAEREALLVDIIEKYEGLLREYNQKCDDYRNEVESRRMWQQKELAARKEVKDTRQAQVGTVSFDDYYFPRPNLTEPRSPIPQSSKWNVEAHSSVHLSGWPRP